MESALTDRRLLFGAAFMNLAVTTIGFLCGLLSDVAFYVTFAAILTVMRVMLFMSRAAEDVDEKVFFAFSHFLTVPALILRHPIVLLAATSVLMAGRFLLLAFIAYRFATRMPISYCFFFYALNNEGVMWAVSHVFKIVVDQWPGAHATWRELANNDGAAFFFFA